jgi:hypothetical protein
MGIRGELYSTKVFLNNRTYFFNVKENRLGDVYLNIVESKNKDEGGFDRQSVVVFADDLAQFLRGFDESLKVLEKEQRKHKGGAPRPDSRPGRAPDSRPGRGPGHGPAERRQDRPDSQPRNYGEHSFNGRGSRGGKDGSHYIPRPVRVVVKKHEP